MSRPRRGRKHLIVMVGLPARGKTFTARKLVGYLSWLGYPTRAFNVGAERRSSLGAGQSHEFFDPTNADAARQREALAKGVLDEACQWLAGEGRIAIYDATNSTEARRGMVRARAAHEDLELLFVEITNDDPAIVADNIRSAKLRAPDYEGVPEADAIADFRKRIAHYEREYRPLAEEEGAWIRIRNRGAQVTLNRIDGWIQSRVSGFLANLQVSERPVWLTRHGQSLFNVEDRIGGDSDLSPAGWEYARNLATHVREHFPGPQRPRRLDQHARAHRPDGPAPRHRRRRLACARRDPRRHLRRPDLRAGRAHLPDRVRGPPARQVRVPLPARRVVPRRRPTRRSRADRARALPHAGARDRPPRGAPRDDRVLPADPAEGDAVRRRPPAHGDQADADGVRLPRGAGWRWVRRPGASGGASRPAATPLRRWP